MIKSFLSALALLLTLSACGSSSPEGAGDSPAGLIAAPIFTNSLQHAGGQGWERVDCFACHPMARLAANHQRVPQIRDSLNTLGIDAQDACMACHGTNGLTPEAGGVQRCLICHGRADIFPPSTFADAAMFLKANIHDLTGSGALDDAVCIICHERSDMNGTFTPAVDLTAFDGPAYAEVNDFCLSCHDTNGAAGIVPPRLIFDNLTFLDNLLIDDGFADIKSTFFGIGTTAAEKLLTADIHGEKPGDVQQFGIFRAGYSNDMILPCLACHYPHSSGNPYLITESGASASTLLTDPDERQTVQQATVAVTQYRFTQLCALCHTNFPEDEAVAANAGNGLKEIVHKGFSFGDCTDCHFHGAGYGQLKNNLF
ncbi:MAG: hypothetical protein A2512_10225 [Deltaproteobacteria bacterium RIFOXYD12_FULL_56_24]|nr:MAG: hypothetical protein A2512_10225 [Deltaproteobacteria bacterium RIFOXYD12_FULL_56_24]